MRTFGPGRQVLGIATSLLLTVAIVCVPPRSAATQESPTAAEQETIGNLVMGSMLFIFLHELGHGLVDQLQLPVVGPEEDVVDEFATFILIAAGDDDPASFDALLAAAISWRLMWQATNDQLQGDFSQFPFWDEHGLDIKRYYNIVCLMYGSDPRAFWPLVSDSGMSVQRARRCEEEYEKKARAWDTLAEPHLVPEGEAPPPGNGQISILYRSAESEYGQYIEGVLREYRIWEQLADGLNQTLLLPNDITIVSGECGIANAFWNPQDRTVNICYEMMAMLTQMFSAAIQGDEQAAPDQPAPATGSEADALIGIWRADSADAQGGSVVTHLVFGADGKFAQITEWQGGAKFEMWGRYRLEGSQLVFGVQGWDPQERCVENRCTPIQLPQSHQQAIRFANADQLIVGSAAFKRQPR